METSDSEYFESADEDFCSDDETQCEQKRNIKHSEKDIQDKLVEKTAKLSVNQDSGRKIIKKNEDLKSEEIVDKTEEIIAQQNDETKHKSNNDVLDIDTFCNRPESIKNTSTPPTKTECWEPGTNNESLGKSPENKSEQIKRPEFGIPPARVGGCSFTNRTGGSFTLRSVNEPRSNLPPAVSRSVDVDNKNIDVQTKPKRPEFGIPPARTTCWVPGVTNPTNIQPSEPHPAYIALMKKKEEERKQMQAQEKERKQIQTKEEERKQMQTKEENKQQKEDIEENMWDNDEDWDDFDATNKQGDTQSDISDKLSNKTSTKIVETIDSKVKPETSVDRSRHSKDNMWEDDDWEPIESNQQQPQHQEKVTPQEEATSSWGSWGNWGLSTVLSTASNLTNQVSQGLSTVLESGIGVPDPEEMARINKLEKERMKETNPKEQIPEEKPILGFGLGNLMQGVSKLVETTSTKVIHGGLDTLETIGKKTMEVLQENDPGLKKKRAFLKLDDDKPILSQLLREAKAKAEHENKELEKRHFARKANYETLFDDHQGLVHLEALEMLSKQCDIKLENLLESSSGDTLNDIQETLDQVKELCELPEEDDEESLSMNEIKEKLETAVSEINITITYKKLLSTWEEVEDWLSKVNLNICNKNELHQQAIEALAQLTALAVEQFHKAGELLLVKEHRSTADEADSLVQLTMTLTTLIGIVAAKFSEKLNMIAADCTEKEEINSLITNVFFEAANSSSYIQDAFQLLMPVLQVGAV